MTEGEYVSLSDVSIELLFVPNILCDMGVKVELPIIVKVDNMGAIFLAK